MLVRVVVAAATVAEGPGPVGDAATAPASAGDDGAMDRARALYQQGEARFSTADFIGAVELWTEAFSIVPDTSDAGRIKALLIYNIATARERAFEVTGDVSYLRQARILMEGYAKSLSTLFGDTDEAEAERQKLTLRLNTIVAQIDAADRRAARGSPRNSSDERPDDAPEADDGRRRKALIGAGAASLVVGVAGLGLMGGGLAMGSNANDIGGLADDDIDGRRSKFDRGRTGNTLAIAGGVVGGVFAVTGAVLLAIGAKRRSRTSTAVAPWVGAGLAGLGMRGRF